MKTVDVVTDLIAACSSVMGELVGKSATDWDLVNTALINGQKFVENKGSGQSEH